MTLIGATKFLVRLSDRSMASLDEGRRQAALHCIVTLSRERKSKPMLRDFSEFEGAARRTSLDQCAGYTEFCGKRAASILMC